MYSRALLAVVFAGVCLRADVVYQGVYRGQAVDYTIQNGIAVTEGDILLGTPEDLEREAAEAAKSSSRSAIGRTGSRYVWPDAVVPYVIESSIASPGLVREAIAHWNTNTPVRLVERSGEANYIRFTKGSGGCSSFVGMTGGGQAINLDDGCGKGAMIHEIGHAVGLFHEQSRHDRDYFVRLLTENLDRREASQFTQHLTDGHDLGDYDYASIMHYGQSGFSRNNKPTLRSVSAGIPFGQRAGLSLSDVEAVRRIYERPSGTTHVSTNPEGLRIYVDGQPYTSPAAFEWAEGSKHTIDVEPLQFKGTNHRYRFVRWNDFGNKTHLVTAGQDRRAFVANFAHEYKLPVGFSPANGGRVDVSPASEDGFYAEGTEVQLTPIPSPGYHFQSWSGFGLFSVHGRSPNPLRFTLNDGDIRYDATFTTTPTTTITSSPLGLEVVIDGERTVTPRSFAWAPSSTHTISIGRTTQTMGNGTSRSEFQSWSDGGEQTHQVTGSSEPQTITAEFNRSFLVSTSVNTSQGGRISLTPEATDGFYQEGTVVEARATPTGSYRFAGWTNDGAESFTVDDQKLISARFSIPMNLTAANVVNAASYQSGISPGQIITIFGLDLGPEKLTTLRLTPAGVVDNVLESTRVYINGLAAPMIYAARDQVSVVVPYAVAGRSTAVLQLENAGRLTNTASLPVLAAAPALFTADSSGRGQAAALNVDSSVNSKANPARRGSVVTLYATGAGQTSPAGVDGKPAMAPYARPVQPIRVTLGGNPVVVEYAGAAPGLIAGVLQVNIRIPQEISGGDLPVVLTVGEAKSIANVSIAVE